MFEVEFNSYARERGYERALGYTKNIYDDRFYTLCCFPILHYFVKHKGDLTKPRVLLLLEDITRLLANGFILSSHDMDIYMLDELIHTTIELSLDMYHHTYLFRRATSPLIVAHSKVSQLQGQTIRA